MSGREDVITASSRCDACGGDLVRDRGRCKRRSAHDHSEGGSTRADSQSHDRRRVPPWLRPHLLGGTGAMLITEAVHEMESSNHEHTITSVCCGGGLGNGARCFARHELSPVIDRAPSRQDRNIAIGIGFEYDLRRGSGRDERSQVAQTLLGLRDNVASVVGPAHRKPFQIRK
jgi:hypothetical protein